MSGSIDSYTGKPLESDYISPHKGINKPRTFFKPDPKVAAQYQTVPRAEGWRVLREGCPERFFPLFLSHATAVRIMDWLVANDASVEVAIVWLKRADLGPLLRLLDHIQEVANEEKD